MQDKTSKVGSIFGIIFALILGTACTFFGTSNAFGKTKIPVEAYKVYLNGEVIGLIKSNQELYDYINKMQEQLMKQYKVNNVYVPNNINVEKDVTYEDNLTSVSNIYNIINEKSPFTIKGYKVVIDKTNAVKYENDAGTNNNEEKKIYINVLDKEIFNTAAKKVVLSFISEEEFNNYENNTQAPIIDVGETIENLYINAKITFVESYLPVNEKIFTKDDELTSYLLFGKNQDMSSYTVQDGDTLSTVAENNKMNVNELLIANSDLKTKDTLLYAGQKITVGVLDPVLQTVKEIHKVEDQTITYKTEYD